jgi:hypothetical protein
MSEHMKLLRFYFWILSIFALGRWGLSLGGVDYAKAHQVFSLVTLALIASAHHAAFARAFAGYNLKRAVMLGALIGLSTQVVIFVSTALSYTLGLTTFFNTPAALNATEPVAFATAMGGRAFGLVVNTILNVIAASIGYALGGALPRRTA